MITINKILKQYGVVPHPRIKNRYTPIERQFLIVTKTKKELVFYVRHPDFDKICRICKHEKYYYVDGTLKEPRDAQWFKENHPEFYEKYFTNDCLHLDLTSKIKDKKIKEDLELYEGYEYVPYVHIETLK